MIPDRTVQDALQDAIESAIARVQQEWTVTVIDAVGALHVVAARLAHKAIHVVDDDDATPSW